MLQKYVLVSLAVGLSSLSLESVKAETESPKFYRAFYLETAQDKCAEALPLYREVAADGAVSAEIKEQALQRLAGCEEEVAAADFAGLMPPTTLAYLEFRRPGEQLSKLLGQLGLLASDVKKATKANGIRPAVSPALIQELMGIRGLGIALTGVDPMKQKPMGVAVLHPGNLEIIRGLLETALPVAAKPVEPIAGFETFNLENEGFATLTSRLIIVGTDRTQIEGVIRRLKGKEKSSLANSEQLATLMKDRGESAFFLAVNAKPIMPMLNAMMLAAGTASPEAALAQQVLDINALNALVIRGGVAADGISGDVTLRMDKGHKNLVYNFVRMPALPTDALHGIPSGAAGFVAVSLNPVMEIKKGTEAEAAKPYVSFMDLGREFFGNVTHVVVAALPPVEEGGSANKIPDVVIRISANDPAKTRAMWTQFMGLAAVAAGGGSMAGTTTELDGEQVQTFGLPEGVTIVTASRDKDLFIATSSHAMRLSLAAGTKGGSILKDASFGADVAKLAPSTTGVLGIHPGRCAQIARRFAPADDVKEIEPFIELLKNTVVAVSVDHSEEVWHAGLRIKGLPDVSPLLAQLIEKEKAEQAEQEKLETLIRGRQWDEALKVLDVRLANQPGNSGLLRRKFDVLATGKKDVEEATALGTKLCGEHLTGATALNNFAWTLLTEDEYDGTYASLARECAVKSNEISEFSDWRFLDTLARAYFETGDVSKAIEWQKKAIAEFNGSGLGEMRAALARFEEAAKAEQVAHVAE